MTLLARHVTRDELDKHGVVFMHPNTLRVLLKTGAAKRELKAGVYAQMPDGRIIITFEGIEGGGTVDRIEDPEARKFLRERFAKAQWTIPSALL